MSTMGIPRVESSSDNAISSAVEAMTGNVEAHSASMLSAVQHAEGRLNTGRLWRERFSDRNVVFGSRSRSECDVSRIDGRTVTSEDI